MRFSISEVDRWVIPDLLTRISEIDEFDSIYSHPYCTECPADDGTTGLFPDFADEYVDDYLHERIDEHRLTLGNHGIPVERVIESTAPDGTTAWIFSIELDVLMSVTKDDLLGVFGGKSLLTDSLKLIRAKRKYAIWGFDIVVHQKELGDWLYEQHHEVDDYEYEEEEVEKHIRRAGHRAVMEHQDTMMQIVDAVVADVRASAVRGEEDEEMFELMLEDLSDLITETLLEVIEERIDYHLNQLNGR